jgi:hypothetical protein
MFRVQEDQYTDSVLRFEVGFCSVICHLSSVFVFVIP